MLDIVNLKLSDLDTALSPLHDKHLFDLKKSWYEEPQKSVSHQEFLDKATTWFRSTKINDLQGWDKFPCVDVIMGCTHFIESLVSKNKWNIQILNNEYAYYTLMGKKSTEPGNLQPGVPLIVSLPNYFHGDRPDWQDVLKECEQKDIDIHVDCAWAIAAKGYKFDFDHPNIKSFAMSMSKYNLQWNRIGLRWSRQRTMDSCTLLSQQRKYNELTRACGSYMMDNIPRDYGWDMYGIANQQICDKLELNPTMFFYVVKDKNGKLYSIGKQLGDVKQ
jgi:hypothetical protein|tara:strand:- start:3027 stop:3851 length:825 start_codon:yes stop_codon:yes gene_type:complete